MPIILENVSFSYSRKTPLETPALRNINLRIEKGEFVGILGEKGAGKSTLTKLFNGLLKPETGKIRVDGLDPSLKEVKRRIGMVFQQAADQRQHQEDGEAADHDGDGLGPVGLVGPRLASGASPAPRLHRRRSAVCGARGVRVDHQALVHRALA